MTSRLDKEHGDFERVRHVATVDVVWVTGSVDLIEGLSGTSPHLPPPPQRTPGRSTPPRWAPAGTTRQGDGQGRSRCRTVTRRHHRHHHHLRPPPPPSREGTPPQGARYASVANGVFPTPHARGSSCHAASSRCPCLSSLAEKRSVSPDVPHCPLKPEVATSESPAAPAHEQAVGDVRSKKEERKIYRLTARCLPRVCAHDSCASRSGSPPRS